MRSTESSPMTRRRGRAPAGLSVSEAHTMAPGFERGATAQHTGCVEGGEGGRGGAGLRVGGSTAGGRKHTQQAASTACVRCLQAQEAAAWHSHSRAASRARHTLHAVCGELTHSQACRLPAWWRGRARWRWRSRTPCSTCGARQHGALHNARWVRPAVAARRATQHRPRRCGACATQQAQQKTTARAGRAARAAHSPEDCG
jgi:hypothetical protein